MRMSYCPSCQYAHMQPIVDYILSHAERHTWDMVLKYVLAKGAGKASEALFFMDYPPRPDFGAAEYMARSGALEASPEAWAEEWEKMCAFCEWYYYGWGGRYSWKEPGALRRRLCPRCERMSATPAEAFENLMGRPIPRLGAPAGDDGADPPCYYCPTCLNRLYHPLARFIEDVKGGALERLPELYVLQCSLARYENRLWGALKREEYNPFAKTNPPIPPRTCAACLEAMAAAITSAP